MNNKDKYYNSFGLDRSIPRSFLKKQELNQLFAIPKKEPNDSMPRFYNFVEDNTHMADILFLPTDTYKKKTYAYALVVVDVATGGTDAEPLEKNDEYEVTSEGKTLKTKWNGPTPKETLDALMRIYKRGTYLKKPSLLITDSGKKIRISIISGLSGEKCHPVEESRWWSSQASQSSREKELYHRTRYHDEATRHLINYTKGQSGVGQRVPSTNLLGKSALRAFATHRQKFVQAVW